MQSWLEVAAKVLPAAIPLLSLLLSLTQGMGRDRRLLSHDAALVEKLPDGHAKAKLLSLVEADLDALLDDSRRRDVPMLVLALIVAPLLWFATGRFMIQASWWGYLLGILTAVGALLFTYGIFESARMVPRDKNGKSIDS